MKQLAIVLSALFIMGIGVEAAAQTVVKTSRDWRVFKAKQGGKTLCYIASAPIKKEGNYSRRSDPLLFVSKVSGGQDEVSTTSGYKYQENKDVKLQISGGKSYKLFPQNEMAWAYTSKDDKSIISQMITKSRMVVHGTSWKGTFSKDTYSLRGFSAAYSYLQKSCK